jgi:hypothetical protein
MYLQPNQFRQRLTPFQSTGVNGAGDANILGTSPRSTLDPTYPVEEIILIVSFTVGTALTTYVTNAYTAGTQVTTAQTPDQYEGPLTIVQHVNLSINDGVQPRSVFDGSGVTFLEYASFNGVKIDQGSALLVALCQNASIPVGNYRLVYRLPCVETWMGEPLRSRCLLPVHRYPNEPVLTLTYNTAANMYSAGHITAVYTDVVLNRRVPTPASELILANDAKTLGLSNPTGYINFDLLESIYTLPLGTGNQFRASMPLTGSYLNVFFRHYLGGANITRKEIDNGATGSAFGTENVWDIESGGVQFRQFAWKDLMVFNEMFAPKEAIILSSGTVSQGYPGGNVPGVITPGAGQNYFRYANSVGINWLTDGLSGDNGTELGSILKADLKTGIKLELVGNPTSVATNASVLYFMGRRLFGNLEGLKVFGQSLRN